MWQRTPFNKRNGAWLCGGQSAYLERLLLQVGIAAHLDAAAVLGVEERHGLDVAERVLAKAVHLGGRHLSARVVGGWDDARR